MATITSLEINQYIDSCVNRYKENYTIENDNDEEFDFLMFKFSPTYLHFENKYEGVDIVVSREIASQLMNMDELYNRRCSNYKSEQKSK